MKFLVAYNGTKEAEAALELARSHAKIFNAELVVVSSSEGGKGEKLEDINKIKHDLEGIKQNLSTDGIGCRVEQLARGLAPGDHRPARDQADRIDRPLFRLLRPIGPSQHHHTRPRRAYHDRGRRDALRSP